MTIQAVSRKAGPYAGNGVTTSFPFAFQLLDKTYLRVVKTDALGADAPLVLDTHYSVALNADQSANPGGSVTYPLSGSALAVGSTLTLVGSEQPQSQTTNLTNGGGFFPETLEQRLDYMTTLTQQHEEILLRTVRGPSTDALQMTDLPTKTLRAGKFMAFDANGLPTVSSGSGGGDTSLRTDLADGITSGKGHNLVAKSRIAAEVTANIVPTNYKYDVLPVIELARYGLDAAASGATNRAALEAALDVASVLGGAILQAPGGAFTLDATVACDLDNVRVRGVGRATIWVFNPASADVLFDFDRGASSVWNCGISNCQFSSSNSVTKTAVRCRDIREFLYEDIWIAQGNWAGAGSIGLHVLGREMLWYQHCFVLCARPVLLDINPNFGTIHTDFFVFRDSQIGSTEVAGKAVEIVNGVNLADITWERIAFLLSKWCVYWVDTTSTIASHGVKFIDCRSEQALDATGYTIEMSSTVQNNQQVTINGFTFDNARNGLKLSRANSIVVRDSQLDDNAGAHTLLNITFQVETELILENTQVSATAVLTLTNAVQVWASPHTGPGVAKIARDGQWRYDDGVVTNQVYAKGYNDARKWEWSGTLANGATLTLPITRAGWTAATVTITAYAAVGPIHCTGSMGWTKNGVSTKHGGSANFVCVAAGVELRVLDGGSGLVVINVLGQSVDLILHAVGK